MPIVQFNSEQHASKNQEQPSLFKLESTGKIAFPLQCDNFAIFAEKAEGPRSA